MEVSALIKMPQMDSLNEYVLDFVKEKVTNQSIKDKFKKEGMKTKNQKMKNIKDTEKKLKSKSKDTRI